MRPQPARRDRAASPPGRRRSSPRCSSSACSLLSAQAPAARQPRNGPPVLDPRRRRRRRPARSAAVSRAVSGASSSIADGLHGARRRTCGSGRELERAGPRALPAARRGPRSSGASSDLRRVGAVPARSSSEARRSCCSSGARASRARSIGAGTSGRRRGGLAPGRAGRARRPRRHRRPRRCRAPSSCSTRRRPPARGSSEPASSGVVRGDGRGALRLNNVPTTSRGPGRRRRRVRRHRRDLPARHPDRPRRVGLARRQPLPGRPRRARRRRFARLTDVLVLAPFSRGEESPEGCRVPRGEARAHRPAAGRRRRLSSSSSAARRIAASGRSTGCSSRRPSSPAAGTSAAPS